MRLESLAGLWPYDRALAIYRFPLAHGQAGEAHEIKFLHPQGHKSRCLCRATAWGLIYGLTAGEYFQGQDRSWRKVTRKTPSGVPRRWIAGAKIALYRPGDPQVPPHQRPDVIDQARQSGDWILAVEGPKDADTAAALVFYATTSANGASGLCLEQARELQGLRVAVLGDHDPAGLRGLRKRADLLSQAQASQVRQIEPLGGEPGSGFDLTDWVEQRRGEGACDSEIAAQLRRKIDTTDPGKPKPQPRSWRCHHPDYLRTDAANAERFLAHVGPRFKHCERMRSWLYWDGARYKEDTLHRAKDTARQTALGIYQEAAELADQARHAKDPDRRAQLQGLAESLA